jgi:hypothetical protein
MAHFSEPQQRAQPLLVPQSCNAGLYEPENELEVTLTLTMLTTLLSYRPGPGVRSLNEQS